MPLRTVRWSWAGRPVRGFCAGSRGRSRSQCVSVSSLVSMRRRVGRRRVCGQALEYLNMKPSTVSGFYLTETGKKPEPLPHMGKRIEFVLNALAPGGTHPDATYLGFARMVRRTYQRMSDGHHLDGLAIVQTGHPDSSRYDLGATYHPSLAKEALDHGTLMTGTLALTAAKHMADLNPLGDDLCAE